jgi:hypothetical protein
MGLGSIHLHLAGFSPQYVGAPVSLSSLLTNEIRSMVVGEADEIVDGLSPGPWRVVVGGPGGTVSSRQLVMVEVNERLEMNLELQANGSLDVLVVRNSLPVESEDISLVSSTSDVQLSGTTDRSGQFSFHALEPGAYLLGVSGNYQTVLVRAGQRNIGQWNLGVRLSH